MMGLLFNSRMVQGIFDDLNPATRDQFQYADTKKWDLRLGDNGEDLVERRRLGRAGLKINPVVGIHELSF